MLEFKKGDGFCHSLGGVCKVLMPTSELQKNCQGNVQHNFLKRWFQQLCCCCCCFNLQVWENVFWIVSYAGRTTLGGGHLKQPNIPCLSNCFISLGPKFRTEYLVKKRAGLVLEKFNPMAVKINFFFKQGWLGEKNKTPGLVQIKALKKIKLESCCDCFFNILLLRCVCVCVWVGDVLRLFLHLFSPSCSPEPFFAFCLSCNSLAE